MQPYTLIRSARSTVSLQIKMGGELVVRAPHLYPKYLINRFIATKSNWITKQRHKQQKMHPDLVRFCSDAELKLLIKRLVTHYSALMSLTPHSLRYRLVRSYWGSCAPSGVISFNLKLAFTSLAAVEYVVVHELAHLKWKGHGPCFWTLVHKYYPKANDVRRILRQFPRD